MSNKQSERKDLLIDVAEMYYIKRMSQEEIAQQIKMSRSNISRLLKQCIDDGVVEFKIRKETSNARKLENEIKKKYDLKYIKVVASHGSSEVNKKEVGKAAADYVANVVEDNIKIGISWGSTLLELVKSIEYLEEKKQNVSVYQILGGFGKTELEADGPHLTKTLSDKLSADPHVINAPLVVHKKELRDLLLDEPQIKRHYEMMKDMDLLLLSIGSLNKEENFMYRAGCITMDDVNECIQANGVADLAGHTINADGEECKTSIRDKIISLDLKHIGNSKIRLGIAAGEMKIDPVKAILKGEYLNAIIIDEVIASKLV